MRMLPSIVLTVILYCSLKLLMSTHHLRLYLAMDTLLLSSRSQ